MAANNRTVMKAKSRNNNKGKSSLKKVKERVSNQQVIQKESKADLEIQPDYSIPSKMQICEEDMKLFAELTSTKQQAETVTEMNCQLDKFEADEKKIDPTKDPEVRAVYIKVGELLSKYRDGKVPDCFSVLPRVSHWESLLKLTRPEKWTPHAYFKTTKIFVASPESRQTLHFFKYYLLPKVLDDISKTGKLNYHLFQALKKGLYRPALWFRGILFPFLKGLFKADYKIGERPLMSTISLGTMKQAQILAAVLMKNSIPNLHASAALLKVMTMDYTGPVGVLVKLLIDKKFALPLNVISTICNWFLEFQNKETQVMPVLWFQTLLSFAKSYKTHLKDEQKNQLKKIVKKKFKHAQLSSEIIRILSQQVVVAPINTAIIQEE